MFANAMKTNTYTWNGAVSLSTPDSSSEYSGRLSLFFKCVRNISDEKLYEYLEKSCLEDIVDTFIIAFNVRDPRGGKGERDLGIKIFEWLSKKQTDIFLKVVQLIPKYGRWEDLLHFLPNVSVSIPLEVSEKVLTLLTEQIIEDIKNMEKGESVSLCAKWMPTENDSMDRKFHLVKYICSYLKISRKEYRTEYIGPLRTYINIVEKMMCSKRWDDIDFSKVPSCSMKKLKKAFERNVPDNFNEWKNKLSTGDSKVNGKVLFPHEIIREIRINKYAVDEVCKAQWNVIEEEVRKLGTLEKALVVVDSSESMTDNNCLPADIAYAMGILISSVVTGDFHNHVITLNDDPTFYLLNDGDIYSRYLQISKTPVGYSTNLQNIFDLILNKAQEFKLKQEDMPTKIFIISDMQFNQIGKNFNTNFQEIERTYVFKGYKRPDIIFWNVNGASTDFPVSVDDNGTCLISGASPYILKSVLKCEKMSSISILEETLNDKRYNEIKECLQ